MDNPESVCAWVLGLLEEAFDRNDVKMGNAQVAVGGVMAVDCCVGLLVVAPETVFRTSHTAFPLPLQFDDVCDDPIIAIGLLVIANRCLTPVDQRGNPPARRKQENSHSVVLKDAATVWKVLADDPVLGVDVVGDPLWLRSGLTQLYTANEGGCYGTETRVTFGVPSAMWCE